MAVRSTGHNGGRRLALALLVLWQACTSAGASEASQNQTDSNASATIATYSVEDDGSTCIFMSSIGTGILLGITDSPEDASVLEEAAQYPNAGAVKELISYHQRGVNVFFTVLWGVIIFFAIFMIAAIIQFIYIMCTGQFQHHVRESNMGVYIFCVIAVIVLLLVMIVLLVCLMGCRSALVDSTDDKVPAVYSSTFDNLRKFVRVTAVESSRVDDRSPRVKHDALERLWPSNNRSLLLSKITPSKVMRNCVNDSVPSLALSRKLNHRKYVERNFYHDPAQRLRMEYELHNSPLSSHRDSNINSADDSFPFDEILCLPNGSTSLLEQPTRTCRGDVRKSLGKLTALGGTGVQLYMDDVEKTMLRKAPFYFSRFVERVVDAVHSSASTGDGRCSTLRSILSSFMDVVCYTYVLELVSYWASLMLATFAAILVIPFCFVLSKYFFRTKRKKIKKRRVREVAESSSLSRRRVREFEESSSLTELPPQADTSSGYSVSLSFTTQEEPTDEVTRRVVYQSRSSHIYDPFAHIYAPAIRRQTSFTSLLTRIPLQHIRRIHSAASYAPQPIAFSRSVICHHHNPPTLPVMAAPVHSPSCILSVPPAPVVLQSPRSTRVVHQMHSHTAVAPHLHRRSRTAVVSTNRNVALSPSVVCVSSPPTILTQPPTVLAAPSRVLTKSTTVLTQQPTVVTQQPTLLTPPSVLAPPPPPTVPLVVSPPPPAPPVTTSPVGSGPAENQQAATAHMTINFYGSPAGGAFTMPMTGYPLGYPTTGYVAAAGQPYYYAAAPVGYAATAPAATPTVAAAQPASFAAPACQYACAVPQPQSVSTHSVSTRSVCSRPSSPVVARVPAATTMTAQPARTQLYAVPPP
ncbi:uncharacterized protein LOC144118037 [Amblyomma americanum]